MTPNSIFVKNTNSLRCENPIGEPFFELSEVGSSNNYAMQMVQAHLAAHGTTWFAHFQNAGKGQRGKLWNAEPGQNIMMSCVLEPNTLSIDNQFVLNTAVALGCFDFFNKYTIDKTCIKWPNDIYWGDRKAGGILIENVLKGEEWKYSIVGIGININQTLFPNGIRNPVSLKQITGKTFNVIDLAKELCSYLENRWKQLLTTPYDKILEEYSYHLYKINQQATFKKENAIFTATVKGVNKKGELLVNTDNQTTIPYNSIEWVLL
ncbi:MAG: biotin--[acetyl-CoA-carboxylase] ligase [Segetibacter sp.]|nr:biotin--[acetyl-CoA-carboxylase] ligase [Segetibacter sp.]